MTEEQITKAILFWLEKNGWEIICFDFPQSGTGVSLHLNDEIRTTKNKGAIIPDIVAFKKGIVVFFENKDHFVLSDFQKVEDLRMTHDYSESINNLLLEFKYSNIFYGVGLPSSKNTIAKCEKNRYKTDFIVILSPDKMISVQYQTVSIF
jgi:hypothetical protein